MPVRPLPLGSALLLALALGCAGGDTPAANAPPNAVTASQDNPAARAGAPAPNAPTSAAPAPNAPANAAPVPNAPAAAQGARPLYYDRALTPADLDGRTLRELSLMRNTIFARAGNPFAKPWLDRHFRAQPWYQPRETVDLSTLTAYDRANVAAITQAEQAIDRTELVARRDAIRARGGGSAEDVVELSLISAALGEWSGSDAVPVDQRNPLEDPTVLDKQLSVDQIDELSRRDLRLLRNTIYARHGRAFKSAVLQQYFADKAWYTPRDDFREAALTAVDKRNIQLVQSMEDRLGGPMREWEHQREEGWFEGA